MERNKDWPRYPSIEVKLTGEDGNAFFLLGKVKQALKGCASQEEIDEFLRDATSGDYDHLLQVIQKWVYVR